MVKIIEYSDVRKLRYRKTPYIIYFYDEENDYSKSVLGTIEKLNNSFPPVVCYACKCNEYPIFGGEKIYSFENVYYFLNRKVNKIICGTSYSELFQIFRSTLYYGFKIFRKNYIRILNLEHGRDLYNSLNPKSYEPDFDKIKIFHKLKINPIARHKYSYPEREFLSSLNDCRIPNDSCSKFGEIKQNKIIINEQRVSQEQIISRSMSINPIFPLENLIFRPPSPPYKKFRKF